MADANSCHAQSFESPRTPTFVQIRPPAAPASTGRKLGILGVGLALVMLAGWAVYRVIDRPAVTVATQAAAPAVAEPPAPPQAPADLYGELAGRAVDTAVAEPVWDRQSLMDRMSPFDPTVAARLSSGPPPADTGDAANAGSQEILVQLGKGETIGSALKKRGFTAGTITEVVSALSPHVKLKQLPVGLDMTVEVRPSGEEGAQPILQALTLHPEGRREIKVERDGDGTYAVEPRKRSSTR
jgi:hypothetical protein